MAFARRRVVQFVGGVAVALALGSAAEAQVDTTAPTISITSPASATTYTAAQRVVIWAAASDNVGVQKVEFYDGTTLKATLTVKPYTFGWSFGAAANGVHKWSAKAYDLSNNVATSNVVALTVNIASTGGTGGTTGGSGGSSGSTGDTTPPIPGTVTASHTQSGTFVSSPFNLTATFTDNESAVTSCQYTTNGTTWAAAAVTGASPTYTCTKTGITGTNGQVLTLNMRATSTGGTGTATGITRTVDAAAPITASNAPTTWVASNQTVTLTPTDAGAGVASTQYCTDATNTCTPATSGASVALTCAAGTACQTYVRFRSTDKVGNVEAIKSALVRIDKVAPGVAIKVPTTAGTWTATGTPLALSGTSSDNIGVSRVTWANAATGGAGTATGTTAWSASVPLANGTNVITVKSLDGANNAATKTLTVTYALVGSPAPDTTPPVPGTVVASSTQSGNFVSSPFTLSTTFTDNQSAVTSCQYTTNGGSTWLAGTVSGASPTFTCTKTGITGTNGQVLTLNMRATSGGGTGTATAISRTVDATAPVTTSNAIAAWVGSNQTVTLTPSDSGSGVASTQYCTDTTNTCTPATNGTSIAVTCAAGATCQTYVRFRSIDQVGNTEATNSALVRIDKAPPVDGAVTATQGNGQVTLSWSGFSDSGSGLAGSPYKLVFSTGSSPAASCTTGTVLFSGSGTSFTQTGLTNGTTYFYRVCASDALGDISTGATASATPQSGVGGPPATPALVGFVPAVGDAHDVVVSGGKAYVASAEFGLSVVNVASPSQPATIGGANPPFYGNRLAVSGTLAAVGAGNGAGLNIVDLSVASDPNTVGFVSGSISGVAMGSGYAYALQLVAGNPAHTDLIVVNLSVPSAPAIVGRVTLAGGSDVTLVGSLVYVAVGTAGLQIVDVSVPAAPKIVTTVNTPGNAGGVSVLSGYAYVADGSSVVVVDVHTPSSASIVGSLAMTAATALKATGTRLYVIDSLLLKVVDISTPTAPALLGSASNMGAQRVDASGTVAFLASSNNTPGLWVVDVSVPANPKALASLYEVADNTGVAVNGTLAASTGTSLGLQIVDVSHPTAPAVLGSLDGNMHGVAMASKYAYVLQLIPGNPAHTDLLVVDLGVPAAPNVVGRLTLGPVGDAVKVVGSLVYVAGGASGLLIVDVSTPTAPRLVGSANTPGTASGVAVGSGYAYVADTTSLVVIDIHNSTSPFVVGSLSTAATAVAAVGARLYVIAGLQLQIIDASTPSAPVLLSSWNSNGADAVDAAGTQVFLARPGVDHYDIAGGVYVMDASNPSKLNTIDQIIVPGITHSVAAGNGFVYAGDGAAIVDVIDLTP